MTPRAVKLIDLTEKTLLVKPEWQKKIANILLNLLRIRDDPQFEMGLDVIVQSGREMLKDEKLEVEADLLLSEAEIASGFPGLTTEEFRNLEDYFKSLLFRLPGSLSEYLAAELGAGVSDYWNVNDFSDMKSKEFAMSRSFANADDPSKEEEFALIGGREVPHSELFRLIESHYVRQGYEINKELNTYSVSARKGDRFVIVVVTEGRKTLITVNVLEF